LFLSFCGAVFAVIGLRRFLAVSGFHVVVNLGYSLVAYKNPTGLFVDWYLVVQQWLDFGRVNMIRNLRSLAQESVGSPALDLFLSALPVLLLISICGISFIVVRRRKDLFLLAVGLSATAGFIYSYSNIYDFFVVAFLFLWFLPSCRQAAFLASAGAVCLVGLGYYYGAYNALLVPRPFYVGIGYALSMVTFILWHVAMILYQRFAVSVHSGKVPDTCTMPERQRGERSLATAQALCKGRV
jgi:hypothetical protein